MILCGERSPLTTGTTLFTIWTDNIGRPWKLVYYKIFWYLNEMRILFDNKPEHSDHTLNIKHTSVCLKQAFHLVFSKFELFLFDEIFILH